MPDQLSLEALQLGITPQIRLQNTSEMMLLSTDTMAIPTNSAGIGHELCHWSPGHRLPARAHMATVLGTPWPAYNRHSPSFILSLISDSVLESVCLIEDPL